MAWIYDNIGVRFTDGLRGIVTNTGVKHLCHLGAKEMNKTAFTNYIVQADYPRLFNELGWDNAGPHDNVTLTDDTDYQLEAIAQKRGFMVYTCHIASIPSTAFLKKTDSQLRKYSNNYILIFIEGTDDTDTKPHHLWLTPIKTVEKRNLVTLEYTTTAQTDFLYSKLNDLSFAIDEEMTIVDVTSRVQRVFEVNATRIIKDFYTGFKRQHTAFLSFIQGIHVEGDRHLYVSVMLNRLMFCYFIQKKGFLNFDPDYLRHKFAWTQQQRGLNQFHGTFYKGFLCILFRQGLNAPNHNDDFEQIYGRIPNLNGGLFDVHTLEKQYADIDIADQAFEDLFDFFDKWRWHLDSRITASGKDINPDVLGYIFEQYINDRAQMGAYYTKEDITEYIAKNCILPFLIEKITEKNPDNLINLIKIPLQQYIYPAVKKGYGKPLPEAVARGLDTQTPNLLERRSEWNKPTPDEYALPTEIWRETIERLQQCEAITQKIANGEITHINDFITYNLDIRAFVEDLLQNTDDHLLIRHFYHALQQVTILDPTCGSGAFLFAALNILEPLYEVCIDRMTFFHKQNNKLFVSELQEIAQKYRSNIQSFIYKSIILRNLYGVDIMEEATEIAKLRLFLKMVAVVDVDRRAPNLGLDPLPDIDFNIRCGNTLIGFDSLTDATHAINSRDNKGHLALIFDNEILNEYLAFTYGIDKDRQPEKYAQWLASHQPFHWFAEFYEIIHSNGGFDVIIGNPPYVVYTANSFVYRLNNYDTLSCANLYAYCCERSFKLLNESGRFGMIVPNSSISADKLVPLQKFFTDEKKTWISNFSWRPSKLFEGADMLLAIIISVKSSQRDIFTSLYKKWYNEFRDTLFNAILYNNVSAIFIEGSIPKIASNIYFSILSKTKKTSSKYLSSYFREKPTKYNLFYFRAVQYWIKILDTKPLYYDNEIDTSTGEMKTVFVDSDNLKFILISILSSTTFFLHYITWASCQVVNMRDFNFCFDADTMDGDLFKKLVGLGKNLQEDYQYNSRTITRNYSKRGRIFTMEKQHFYIKKSKPIIDEIDKVLAAYYGFTEEELDFIINYDIKYRMGNDLNEED